MNIYIRGLHGPIFPGTPQPVSTSLFVGLAKPIVIKARPADRMF